MDKELLARKLYVGRVEALLRDQPLDEHVLEEMWENRASLACSLSQSQVSLSLRCE
ncbi:hypothetical protein [Vibrio tarriae]|uniref:hypothetical protein n=1 Tax=Vibrio tarriae TaxID=2014742 RepID=UPI0018DFBF53|nr:hypothetical protein [Vibrio tarriae]